MKQQHTYNPGINFLRSISILGIVLYHIVPFVIQGGYLGVCIFFLISGYLAATKSEMDWKNQEYSFKTYYRKKGKRIYPSLYVMVMSIVAFFTLFHKELLLGMREEVLSIFLGVNNWWQMATQASYFTQVTKHSPFTHLWYMGVEIELLLLWPVLFWLYKKLQGKKLGKWSVGIFAILTVASVFLMAILYQKDAVNRVYYGTDTRSFAFFMGVYLGLREKTWTEKMPGWIKGTAGRVIFAGMLLITVILFCLVPGEAAWLYQGGMAAICLFFALMILVMNACGFEKSLLTKGKILQLLGRHSYLIYLWHYPLLFILFYLY